MRGKAGWSHDPDVGLGITPAYAGKSPQNQLFRKRPQDHPRVCGEKIRQMIVHPLHGGSPPRMRGKAHGLPSLLRDVGITPAYAGKSVCRFDRSHVY